MYQSAPPPFACSNEHAPRLLLDSLITRQSQQRPTMEQDASYKVAVHTTRRAIKHCSRRISTELQNFKKETSRRGKMNRFTVISIVSIVFILSCNLMVDSRPIRARRRHADKRHVVQKRATVAEVLGDLTAGASGILNEDSKSSLLSDSCCGAPCSYTH